MPMEKRGECNNWDPLVDLSMVIVTTITAEVDVQLVKFYNAGKIQCKLRTSLPIELNCNGTSLQKDITRSTTYLRLSVVLYSPQQRLYTVTKPRLRASEVNGCFFFNIPRETI